MIPGLGPGGLLPVEFLGQPLELSLSGFEFCLGEVQVGRGLGDSVSIVLQGLAVGLDLAFQELDLVPAARLSALKLSRFCLAAGAEPSMATGCGRLMNAPAARS